MDDSDIAPSASRHQREFWLFTRSQNRENDDDDENEGEIDQGDAEPTEQHRLLTSPSVPPPLPPPLVRSLSTEARSAIEKGLVRKIDLRLIPPLVVMYIMNYLDRNNIASARLAGLEDDIDLRGTQYQTCVSILFIGYLVMQVPSNLLLNTISKPRIYLASVMMIWGVISALTATVQNFSGLVALRFFLGFVEAPYCCLFYLSCWYTRKELVTRTAMLYSGSLISGAFSGLIAAGITKAMDGAWGLSAWRWLFIIEGSTTVGLAFCAIFVLPDFPRTTAWLSETEKQLAAWRLQEDIGEDDRAVAGVGTKHDTRASFAAGFVLACKDVKMWIMMLLSFGISFAGSVTNFFPSVVQTLGYGRIESLLLTAPPYGLAVLTTFCNAWHADRTGDRCFHVTMPLCIAMVAFVMAQATTHTGLRYLAMVFMPSSIYPGYVVVLGWISNTIPRPPAKRAAALAFINAVSNSSSIFSAYLFKTSMAPRYVLAMSVCCGFAMVAIASASALRVLLTRLNAQLDRGEWVEGVTATHNPVEASDGVGGKAMRKFRFLI